MVGNSRNFIIDRKKLGKSDKNCEDFNYFTLPAKKSKKKFENRRKVNMKIQKSAKLRKNNHRSAGQNYHDKNFIATKNSVKPFPLIIRKEEGKKYTKLR